MTERQRIHYIDVARGMAMILVIIGHIGMKNQLVQWIYSFHMPLFFIMSGMVMKSVGDTEHKVKELLKYIISKIKAYLVPYIIFAFIFSLSDSIYRTLFAVYGSRESLVMAETRTALWFLPALFCTSVIYKFCLMVFGKIKEEMLDALLFVAGIILSMVCCGIDIGIGFPLSINISMIAIAFIAIGRLMRKEWNKLTEKKNWMVAVALFCGPVSVIMYSFNLPTSVTEKFNRVEMSVANYGNYAFFIVNACIGSAFVLAVACLINKCVIMEYIGKNTIAILGVHGFIIDIAFAVCRKVITENIVLYVVVFTFALIASTVCAFMIDKLAPNLNGK